MHSPALTRIAQVLASAGLLSAGAALAQTDAPATAPVKSTGIAEVVVTAQKIAQPAIKTPVALSVIGGDDLKDAGINEARALADMVPNVQIGQESGKLQIAIRGVASLDMTEKGDPSAAFNLDGAYIARPEAQTGAFFDLERIEVLRGPQGTLYGRNATAGAINVITAKPEKRLGGKVSVELGNYNTRRLDGMINVPVNDILALRAAVSVNKHDSWFNPGPNTDIPLESQDDRAARLHALATFSKDTSLLLTAESSKVGGGGATPIPITNFFDGTPTDNLPFSPAGTGNNLQNPVYVDRGSDVQRTASWRFKATDAHRDNHADALRGEFKTTLGEVGVTYQLAHLKSEIDEMQNGVYFGFPFTGEVKGQAKSTSHELRFNSGGSGPLRWVAGLYAFDESIDRLTNYNTYITAPFGQMTILVPYLPHVTNKSKAAFGQATWSFRPDTRLIVGLRRTKDEKTGRDPLAGTAPDPGQTTSSAAYDNAVSFNNTSWKLGLDHDLSKGVMLYASAATGYKAGGFNDQASAGSYKPEHLTAYEAGVKGRFLDNTLQVTANYFHYNYTDLQLTSIVCRTNDPTTCGSRTTNAANAKVDGAELEGTMKVGEDGTLRANLALTRAQFKHYQPNSSMDWSGQNLDRAPEHTVGLGYTHHFPLASGAELSANVNTRYSGAYMISDPSAGVRYEQPSFHKSDLVLGYTTANGKTTVQLYAKNLEDQITIESRVPGAFFVSDPRTFGARVSYSF
jgi:iron complex outermembrane receptor protein